MAAVVMVVIIMAAEGSLLVAVISVEGASIFNTILSD